MACAGVIISNERHAVNAYAAIRAPVSGSKKRKAPRATAISAIVSSSVGASAANRPTNDVRRAARRLSSSLRADASTSSARSRVSGVTTGAASTSKWTTTSEPSSSRRRTKPRSRRSCGVADASAASSRCSGRTPTTTSRPSCSAEAARERVLVVVDRQPLAVAEGDGGGRRPSARRGLRRSSSRGCR